MGDEGKLLKGLMSVNGPLEWILPEPELETFRTIPRWERIRSLIKLLWKYGVRLHGSCCVSSLWCQTISTCLFCTVKSLSMKTDALLSPISPPLPPVSPHEVRGDETAPPATARSLVHTRGVSSAGKNTDTPQILLKTYKLKAITGLVQQVNIEPYLFRSLSVMSALVCSRGT